MNLQMITTLQIVAQIIQDSWPVRLSCVLCCNLPFEFMSSYCMLMCKISCNRSSKTVIDLHRHEKSLHRGLDFLLWAAILFSATAVHFMSHIWGKKNAYKKSMRLIYVTTVLKMRSPRAVIAWDHEFWFEKFSKIYLWDLGVSSYWWTPWFPKLSCMQ